MEVDDVNNDSLWIKFIFCTRYLTMQTIVVIRKHPVNRLCAIQYEKRWGEGQTSPLRRRVLEFLTSWPVRIGCDEVRIGTFLNRKALKSGGYYPDNRPTAAVDLR